MAARPDELSQSPPTSSHPPPPIPPPTSTDTSVATVVEGTTEQLTHPPSSEQRRCVRRIWSETPGTGVAWVLYRPCSERRCDDCGADNRQRRADQLAGLVGQTTLWRLELAAATWRNARDRMRRHKGPDGQPRPLQWVPVPVGDGVLVVFTDQPWPGAAQIPAGHNLAELSAACSRLPVGARVFPSRGWPATTPTGDHDQAEPRAYGMLLVDDQTMQLTAQRVGAAVRRYPFGYRVDMTQTSNGAARELHRNTTYRPETASSPRPHGHHARPQVDGHHPHHQERPT